MYSFSRALSETGILESVWNINHSGSQEKTDPSWTCSFWYTPVMKCPVSPLPPPPAWHTWTAATHLYNVPGAIWPGILCPVNRDVKQARWKDITPRNTVCLLAPVWGSHDDYSLGSYKGRKMTCYCLDDSWCLEQSLLFLVLVSLLGRILGLSNEGGYQLEYPKGLPGNFHGLEIRWQLWPRRWLCLPWARPFSLWMWQTGQWTDTAESWSSKKPNPHLLSESALEFWVNGGPVNVN